MSEVVGSDSHVSSDVGTKYTWVKMGEPSLESLKLALHDCEDGVIRYDTTADDPNQIANRYYIDSIKIDNGYKAGNGLSLNPNFNPWLNSIIGGRVN